MQHLWEQQIMAGDCGSRLFASVGSTQDLLSGRHHLACDVNPMHVDTRGLFHPR